MVEDGLLTTIKTNQYYYEINSSDRFTALCRLLDAVIGKKSLVFCRTKRDVDYLTEKLELLNYKVSNYHGDLSPTNREKNLKKLADGTIDTLLITDIQVILTAWMRLISFYFQ